jgi:hypothetical protein
VEQRRKLEKHAEQRGREEAALARRKAWERAAAARQADVAIQRELTLQSHMKQVRSCRLRSCAVACFASSRCSASSRAALTARCKWTGWWCRRNSFVHRRSRMPSHCSSSFARRQRPHSYGSQQPSTTSWRLSMRCCAPSLLEVKGDGLPVFHGSECCIAPGSVVE